MSSFFSFIARQADVKKRLDVFLKEHLPEHSRSQIQRWITNGAVTCNEKKVKPAYLLELDDAICGAPSETEYSVSPENIPLDILYEDEGMVVINKSAGIVTHPAVGHRHGTLAHALAHHFLGSRAYGKQGTYGAESLRPGIVHRLDKDTSGVIVVAKTVKVLEHLSQQFQDRSVQKIYRTIVCGIIREKKGEIIGSISAGQHSVKMLIAPGGKHSQTNFSVLKRFKAHTYLEVFPQTGRTHQIRLHLSEIRHPVLGDALYGAKSPLCSRQMLHAYQLTLQHPKTKKMLTFTAPLPKDFLTTLKKLV